MGGKHGQKRDLVRDQKNLVINKLIPLLSRGFRMSRLFGRTNATLRRETAAV